MSYKEIYIKPHTPKWYQFRMRGIGSSEAPSVCSIYSEPLAQETYVSGVKTFMEKIGEPVPPFMGNIHTESGHFHEPHMIGLYRHFDKTNDDPVHVFINRTKGLKFNRVVRRQAYVVNRKYPWLFGSPDAFGYKGKKRYGVEAKFTNSIDAGKYVNKISPSFIIQVMTILIITGWEYVDVCIFIDGKWFHVHTVTPDKEWFDFIIESTYDFWSKVQEARNIKIKYGVESYYGVHEDFMPAEWKEAKEELKGNSPVGVLQSLEPEFTGTGVEHEFIKKMIIPRADDSVMEITQEQWEILMKYKENLNMEKKYANEKAKSQHGLIRSLGGYNRAEIPEDTSSYFSYKENKNGEARLYVSDKLLNQI